ncbi:MAG TPA: TauD/TfdA family dioxygenase [Thermoanaerobaculia bacterium]
MSNGISESGFNRFGARPRKAVRLSQEDLVKTGFLPESGGQELPLVVEPNVEDLNLTTWAESHRELIEAHLLRHGTVLFRGFDVPTPAAFHEVAQAICPGLLDYTERAAPRHEVSQNVYTSTEFPADQHIPLHHEMSYSHNWPTKLFFFCDLPAQEGGCTPVTDDRKVIQLLDPEVTRRFLEKKVMYVRNYGEGVDMPWQEVFQTQDRQQVEAYCREARMEVEWRDRDRLRTRAIRQVLATHPKTGDVLWFNHAHLFHMSNLEPAVRQALLSEFEPDELPRNAFYGDGTPIEDEVLEQIRQTYSDAAVRFPWRKGDIMLVDNFLASHGRDPFKGPRRILVAMAELYTNPEL